MNRHVILFVAIIVVVLSDLCARGSTPKNPAETPANENRATDRKEIRDTLISFAKAFEARDAKQLAKYWTAEGEHQTAHGETVHGRAALEQGFAQFFTETPEIQAEIQPTALRFTSQDTAVDEGIVTIRRGATEAPTRAHYEAHLVREQGFWRLAILNETPEDSVAITDLSWLIGEWKSAGPAGAEIRTTYSWDDNHKFINVQFTITEGSRTLTGRQVIGVDPATESLHSWTFGANGGVGEADWIRDGDHWILDAAGTQPDGRTLKESNILRRVNDDTITFQSTNRSIEDQEIPDLAPVKVVRVKSVAQSAK